MENSADYINHVNIVKNLEIYNKDTEETSKSKKFDAIYEKAKEEDVKLSNAKEFINDLSKDEMQTLLGNVDENTVDELSNEGAYNLLMRTYEQYDFDNDGYTEIGKAKAITIVPRNMEADAKEAWVNTINSLDEKDMMSVMVMSLSLDPERLKRILAEGMSQMSEAQRAQIQEKASFDIDKFIEETLSKEYHPKRLNYEDIESEVDEIVNSKNQRSSSPQMIEATTNFWNIFQNEYQKVKDSKIEQTSTSQILETKNQVEHSENKTTQTALEKALNDVA